MVNNAESTTFSLETYHFHGNSLLRTVREEIVGVASDWLRTLNSRAFHLRQCQLFLVLLNSDFQLSNPFSVHEQIWMHVLILYNLWIQVGELLSREFDCSLHSGCIHDLNNRLLVRWQLRVLVNEFSGLLKEISVELADLRTHHTPHQLQVRFVRKSSDGSHLFDW